jgi:hypothetical protein
VNVREVTTSSTKLITFRRNLRTPAIVAEVESALACPIEASLCRLFSVGSFGISLPKKDPTRLKTAPLHAQDKNALETQIVLEAALKVLGGQMLAPN